MIIVNEDGTATAVDDWSLKQIDRHLAIGGQVYATLGGAVLYSNVKASAFDHPMRAEPVYDGASALAALEKAQTLPKPVGLIASYRVSVYEGAHLCPARHPHDLPRRAA